MLLKTVHASIPAARDGASYIKAHRAMMEAAAAVSKTDADTDYRSTRALAGPRTPNVPSGPWWSMVK